jgi:hypothetical protein
MNKLLTVMAAVSTLAIAAPVAAQTSAGVNANAGGQMGIGNRIARLETRIQTGVDAGTIDRTEARTLRQQLRDITRVERQYSRGGYSQQERSDLQQRLRGFRDQLAQADGRGGQYGYGNGYPNGNANDAYGQGGPYEEAACESRSSGGIGGIFDNIFGGGGGNSDECSGLRVGERASGNLSALPSEYRRQFRDGNGIAYRTDGNQIYQVDTRNNTVLRVYGMNR